MSNYLFEYPRKMTSHKSRWHWFACIYLAVLPCALMSAVNSQSALPEPYRSVELLPFDPHGWFSNASQLERLFQENEIRDVIEVGCWLGLSTRFFATHIKQPGKVYAVDTWLGSDEQAHREDPRLPYLYQQFLSNMCHAGLAHIVVPVRMDSLVAASALDAKADLIYIDAAHTTDAVFQDIMHWYDHLKHGGIMCGDDWGWHSVRMGVFEAAKLLGMVIVTERNFWCLRPRAYTQRN